MTTRKKVMKQKEMVWRNNKKLSDLEEVAKERAQNLLQRANKLRMEQEEELKDMSKVGALHFFFLLIHTLAPAGDGARRGQGKGFAGVKGRCDRAASAM